VLTGRESERSRVERLVVGARAGRGGALLVHGEPGIGKTALLEHARSLAAAGDPPLRVLDARGYETESEITFTGLYDLVAPLLDLRDRLPPAQAIALGQALALDAEGTPDRFAVPAALLGLVGGPGRRRGGGARVLGDRAGQRARLRAAVAGRARGPLRPRRRRPPARTRGARPGPEDRGRAVRGLRTRRARDGRAGRGRDRRGGRGAHARALPGRGDRDAGAGARTELARGERPRRRKARAEAREPLRAALETFERLGARLWAERARNELRATGVAATGEREAVTPVAELLTPHELQVALTVARGATNREAAAALFVSPKTVEHHLGQIYRKLGVRSRTQLAALLDQERRLGGAAA